MDDQFLKDWIYRIGACFGKRIPDGQITEWVEEMRTWVVYPPQWERILKRIKLECEKAPALSQIHAIARDVCYDGQETEPNWKTWKDADGRSWAKIMPGYRATRPTQRDLEQWEAESVKTDAERRKWFAVGWIRSGTSQPCEPFFAQVNRLKNLADKIGERRKRKQFKEAS